MKTNLGKPRKDYQVILTGSGNFTEIFEMLELKGDSDKSYLLQLDQEAGIRFVFNDDASFSNYEWYNSTPIILHDPYREVYNPIKNLLTGDTFIFYISSGGRRQVKATDGNFQLWLNTPDEVNSITAFIEQGEVNEWQLSRKIQ